MRMYVNDSTYLPWIFQRKISGTDLHRLLAQPLTLSYVNILSTPRLTFQRALRCGLHLRLYPHATSALCDGYMHAGIQANPPNSTPTAELCCGVGEGAVRVNACTEGSID